MRCMIQLWILCFHTDSDLALVSARAKRGAACSAQTLAERNYCRYRKDPKGPKQIRGSNDSRFDEVRQVRRAKDYD